RLLSDVVAAEHPDADLAHAVRRIGPRRAEPEAGERQPGLGPRLAREQRPADVGEAMPTGLAEQLIADRADLRLVTEQRAQRQPAVAEHAGRPIDGAPDRDLLDVAQAGGADHGRRVVEGTARFAGGDAAIECGPRPRRE